MSVCRRVCVCIWCTITKATAIFSRWHHVFAVSVSDDLIRLVLCLGPHLPEADTEFLWGTSINHESMCELVPVTTSRRCTGYVWSHDGKFTGSMLLLRGCKHNTSGPSATSRCLKGVMARHFAECYMTVFPLIMKLELRDVSWMAAGCTFIYNRRTSEWCQSSHLSSVFPNMSTILLIMLMITLSCSDTRLVTTCVLPSCDTGSTFSTKTTFLSISLCLTSVCLFSKSGVLTLKPDLYCIPHFQSHEAEWSNMKHGFISSNNIGILNENTFEIQCIICISETHQCLLTNWEDTDVGFQELPAGRRRHGGARWPRWAPEVLPGTSQWYEPRTEGVFVALTARHPGSRQG